MGKYHSRFLGTARAENILFERNYYSYVVVLACPSLGCFHPNLAFLSGLAAVPHASPRSRTLRFRIKYSEIKICEAIQAEKGLYIMSAIIKLLEPHFQWWIIELR